MIDAHPPIQSLPAPRGARIARAQGIATTDGSRAAPQRGTPPLAWAMPSNGHRNTK